jgi:uncharacterized protein YukE
MASIQEAAAYIADVASRAETVAINVTYQSDQLPEICGQLQLAGQVVYEHWSPQFEAVRQLLEQAHAQLEIIASNLIHASERVRSGGPAII